MTPKELKRLSRKDLLELLLEQTERGERLEKELAETKAMLNDKTIGIAQSGTMAEAALRLNGVYQVVDRAAAQYLRNVQKRCQAMEEETRRRCNAMLQQAGEEDAP
jgi:hypothetical protein